MAIAMKAVQTATIECDHLNTDEITLPVNYLYLEQM